MAAVLNQQEIAEPQFHESGSYFVFLWDMRSIVKHSFLVHKSIAYLDLNIGEYSLSKCDENSALAMRNRITQSDFISTRESSKKNLVKNRTVLYNYHLDVSTELETTRSKSEKTLNADAVLLNGIIIPSGLYDAHLYEMIISNLLKTQELKFVKSILKIMKFVNLPGKSIFLMNRCLEILYSQCANSDIVDDFSATVRLREWDMIFVKPRILEFFLRHGDCKDCSSKEFHRRQELIYYCIYTYKFENVGLLLKHYHTPKFSEYVYTKTKSSLRIASPLTLEEMEMPVAQGWITRERNLQVLQTLDIFYSSAFSLLENSRLTASGSEALRQVWSSIPDVLISLDELQLFYRDTQIRRDIGTIHKFYEHIVKEKVPSPRPRQLKDYCRITIRKCLSENRQLPDGIGQLGLPVLVQSFLNLQQTWLR